MSPRSHLWLRFGAVALLAVAAIWPRAKADGSGLTPAELARDGIGHVTTHGVAALAETTSARLVSPPRNAKLVVAQADDSRLTN
jgi:hypothetical protein